MVVACRRHPWARVGSREAVCGSNGSILNYAKAQMNHTLAAFHQHSPYRTLPMYLLNVTY